MGEVIKNEAHYIVSRHRQAIFIFKQNFPLTFYYKQFQT